MSQYQVMAVGDTALGQDVANRAARVLMLKYPVQSPHMWYVEVKDGLIWLKSSMTGKATFAKHLNKINFSESNFEKEIERAAGEFLERAHLSRSSTDLSYATKLDGGEAIKWKPDFFAGR